MVQRSQRKYPIKEKIETYHHAQLKRNQRGGKLMDILKRITWADIFKRMIINQEFKTQHRRPSTPRDHQAFKRT